MRAIFKQDGLRAAFVFAIVALAAVTRAQPTALYKGFNDPKTLVHEKMAGLPASLHLTTRQRRRLQTAYLALATFERKVINQPGSMLAKRAKVGAFSRRTEEQIRNILTRGQYRILRLSRFPASQKGHPARSKAPASHP